MFLVPLKLVKREQVLLLPVHTVHVPVPIVLFVFINLETICNYAYGDPLHAILADRGGKKKKRYH